MEKFKKEKFSDIMKEMIKKSLFTERQVEIILKQRRIIDTDFHISKGAYYRQVQQSRHKLMGVYYSLVLLQGLGLLEKESVDVINRLGKQVNVINQSDIFDERDDDIIQLIDKMINQLSKL